VTGIGAALAYSLTEWRMEMTAMQSATDEWCQQQPTAQLTRLSCV